MRCVWLSRRRRKADIIDERGMVAGGCATLDIQDVASGCQIDLNTSGREILIADRLEFSCDDSVNDDAVRLIAII